MQQRRVSFHTLGCKLNFSESSTLAREFEQGGFVRVAPEAEADICVVNTCSVTEHADKKCRNLIRKLHRRNPGAIIAVTGCYAQLKPEDIAAIDGVDIVLGNNDKGDLYKRVLELTGKGRARVYSCDTDSLTRFFAAFSSGDRTRAFLKVQDGCDYCCAYCTIHYARGASRNLPVADAVAEARQIAAAGQKEIVITGVNTGDFGRTTGEKFIDLLRALDAVEGIERYRISSIEPNLLTDDIVEFCAASPKFQHHFHIPLQSGSDRILGLMRRRYTTARFAGRIEAVRRLMPDAFIGIDVIVGFPGETEADFGETYAFLERTAPAFLHIFPFSERPGTPAVALPGKLQPAVAARRGAELEALCERLHGTFCAKAVGTEDRVLFESTRRGGMMFGFTGNYRRVKAPYDRARVNTVCRVRLGAMDESHDLAGEILD
ncbi:tRNA (N(6)-L-threonylcarbamoyladenosine(37)-C(2))-methylthiotransferase MtaB [Alistipes sp. CHKCI003]|uniref:tRNA (N(6)-L-threonylcarbamoyladenosine(37)-C(2))- methylthiotransferase MtaB n=1 Tax=Alistipes sp. CHKCI003 TaxID=1780376 RepID=UPI0007A7CFCE|nr:tRNA (N(6)-L-threonylcarbamoyladenosine(37)-C(2))-methylthiotransferase MtaB [Alistipes sp. CHKCI003]CVI65891.1 Threonylcarbamoyladenosine tRNA methylthiotransferase MtaB [Alistipes sp. CHKCI003]